MSNLSRRLKFKAGFVTHAETCMKAKNCLMITSVLCANRMPAGSIMELLMQDLVRNGSAIYADMNMKAMSYRKISYVRPVSTEPVILLKSVKISGTFN